MIDKTEEGAKDFFKKRLWDLRPQQENFSTVYKIFYKIIGEYSEATEEFATKELLAKHYNEYIQYKNILAQTGAHFNEKKIESLSFFLTQGLWKNSYKSTPIESPERDNYLYEI